MAALIAHNSGQRTSRMPGRHALLWRPSLLCVADRASLYVSSVAAARHSACYLRAGGRGCGASRPREWCERLSRVS